MRSSVPGTATAKHCGRTSGTIFSDDWNVEAATRFERYDGAGSSITGMVGSRIDLNPTVSLRATASTGFRAPSLPQLGFNTIVFSGEAGGLSVTSHLEDGAAFEFFGEGSPDLQHETSRNLSFGAVWTPSPDLSISADIYRIDIRDRITLIKQVPDCAAADAAACGRLAAERGIQHITNIQFFANAVDTTTSGLDIVASRDWPFMEGQFTLSGTLHFNETDVDKEIETISSLTRSFIEEGVPQATASHFRQLDRRRQAGAESRSQLFRQGFSSVAAR